MPRKKVVKKTLKIVKIRAKKHIPLEDRVLSDLKKADKKRKVFDRKFAQVKKDLKRVQRKRSAWKADLDRQAKDIASGGGGGGSKWAKSTMSHIKRNGKKYGAGAVLAAFGGAGYAVSRRRKKRKRR